MASLRTLKLRAWIKQRTGIFYAGRCQHPASPCPFAWDSYVCDNIDPEQLFNTPEQCTIDALEGYAEYRAKLDAYNACDSAPDLYRNEGLL